MRCPHCNKNVSFFSRAMNRFGKIKICPHCGEKLRVRVSFKRVALWFLPTLVLTLLLRPFLGSLGSVPGLFIVIVMSLQLLPVEEACKELS